VKEYADRFWRSTAGEPPEHCQSGVRRSNCNLARIEEMCPGRNGVFGSVSLPLFDAGLVRSFT